MRFVTLTDTDREELICVNPDSVAYLTPALGDNQKTVLMSNIGYLATVEGSLYAVASMLAGSGVS